MFALWLWDVFISTLRCFHFDSEMFSLRLELRRFHFDNQVTASTVGYGDICVRTSLGKLAVDYHYIYLQIRLLTINYFTLTNSTFFTSFSILIITFNQHWSLSRLTDSIAFLIDQCAFHISQWAFHINQWAFFINPWAQLYFKYCDERPFESSTLLSCFTIIPRPGHTWYLSFFFTQAKFLENKIYTEKRQFFALNL